MLPSIDIRIQNLVKALQQVVLPAVNPDNKLAQEQAHLVIAHLQMIGLQWDQAFAFEGTSLQAMITLSRALCTTASGGDATVSAIAKLRSATEACAAAQPVGARAVAELITRVGNAIDETIFALYADADADSRKACQDLILTYSKRQAHRERVWFAANNLDPDRQKLESIDELLAADRAEAMS